jgi:hypothetical protein
MTKKLGIMQPYFLPYIGYWQLIAHVDAFVLYDQIKYTKKGWINRNRLLLNGQPDTFSLPLKSDSDYLAICDRELAPTFQKINLLRKFQGAYSKAPFWKEVYPLLEEIFNYNENNLFNYIFYSIKSICKHLEIDTSIDVSSQVETHKDLYNQERVIHLCQDLHATTYINPIGGVDLYDGKSFTEKGVDLQFLKSNLCPYPQFNHEFIPALSIIDVLSFNGIKRTQDLIHQDFQIMESAPSA